MVVPTNSGAAGSPGGSTTGRGCRTPTITAAAWPNGGGSGTLNHGPGAAGARLAPPRPAGSWASPA